MPQRLRVKRIDTVGLVDKGDDPEAEVVFWKRATPEKKKEKMSKPENRFTQTLMTALRKLGLSDDEADSLENAAKAEGWSPMTKKDDKLSLDEALEKIQKLEKDLETATERAEKLAGELEDAQKQKDEPAEKDEPVDLPPEVQKRFETLEARAEAAEELAKRHQRELDLEKMAKRADEDLRGISGDRLEKAQVLLSMRENLDDDAFDKVMEMLKSANELAAQAGVFKEWGSEGGDGAGDAWDKIESLARQLVEKSDDALSQADAVSKVLETDEGRTLYNQYLQEN